MNTWLNGRQSTPMVKVRQILLNIFLLECSSVLEPRRNQSVLTVPVSDQVTTSISSRTTPRTHTHTPTHAHPCSNTHTDTHTHTHTHTHSPPQTQTHTHTHTHTTDLKQPTEESTRKRRRE